MPQLSFSTLGCPDYSVDEIISLALSSRFDGVELRVVSGQMDLLSLPDFTTDVAATRRKFEDAGLDISCLDTSVLVASGGDAAFETQRELAKRMAGLAADLGAPVIRIFGGPEPEERDVAAVLPSIADGLSTVADDSHAVGVVAAIETHGTLSASSSLTRLLELGVSDHLAILWDVLHTYRHGEPLAESFAAVRSRLRHVHLKDAAGMEPTAKDFVLTGDGVVPVVAAIDLLDEAGYSDYVSFEWEKYWAPDIEDPEVAIPQFADHLREVYFSR